MSEIDAEAERLYDKLGRGEQTDVKTIRAALLAAEKRGKEEAAKHLDQIAQAMWERCESKRPENPFEIGEGEEEDAAMAYCFDKAAAAIRGS